MKYTYIYIYTYLGVFEGSQEAFFLVGSARLHRRRSPGGPAWPPQSPWQATSERRVSERASERAQGKDTQGNRRIQATRREKQEGNRTLKATRREKQEGNRTLKATRRENFRGKRRCQIGWIGNIQGELQGKFSRRGSQLDTGGARLFMGQVSSCGIWAC